MNNKFLLLLALSGAMLISSAKGQDDLMSMIDKNETPTIDYTSATFKTTRVVIGQSIELPPKGNLLFLISHHFGALNTGYENLYGLKQASIRLGLEYGLTNWLGFGAGLNTDKNTWDGFVKAKVFRQSTGARKMPVTLDLFANTAIYTIKWPVPDQKNYFSSRMAYAFQIMIARKFNSFLSFQLTGSMVHKNMVPTSEDKNDIFTLGAGGRVKVSQRVALSAEYHYLFTGQVVSTLKQVVTFSRYS
ncbi:MAG: DUF5777 family beta-barrel protein [Bacteroidetes bacterium]|nr:DUF5777 family beta-barrel protein [Bacteroidota bacterium]